MTSSPSAPHLRNLPQVVTSAPGVALTPGPTEDIIGHMVAGLRRLFGQEYDRHLCAPAVLDASVAARTGYASSFTHLLGTVRVEDERPTGLVLAPAACHHVYPLFEGRTLDAQTGVSVLGHCFRNEVTAEPGRLRAFRMYEIVLLGDRPDDCRAWRDRMLREAARWLAAVGIAATAQPANDPFFGRGGRLLASAQLDQDLKWELAAPVADGVTQAVASANYHKEHFGEAFSIAAPGGGPAHTACVGFGLERLALAFGHAHGGDPRKWPRQVREELRL